jgi:hypothetical protein
VFKDQPASLKAPSNIHQPVLTTFGLLLLKNYREVQVIAQGSSDHTAIHAVKITKEGNIKKSKEKFQEDA